MLIRKKKPPNVHYTNAITGPFCDAPRIGRPGKFCKQPAGFRTAHPGQGTCFKHGGNKPITHGRYSKIRHHSVRSRMEELALMETNVLDLEPEALLLRALTSEYIDRYEEFVDALLEWYKQPDVKVKPRRIMDISDAAGLIESISRVVEKIHKIQSEGAISLATFARVTEQMGIIVAQHVRDEATLTKIEKDWSSLALDAKNVPITPELDDEE